MTEDASDYLHWQVMIKPADQTSYQEASEEEFDAFVARASELLDEYPPLEQ